MAKVAPAATFKVAYSVGPRDSSDGLQSLPLNYETTGYAGDNIVLHAEALEDVQNAKVECTIIVNGEPKAHKPGEVSPRSSCLLNFTLPF